MVLALLALLQPAHAARTGVVYSDCAIGQIHFDGACRSPSWFSQLAPGGSWTLDDVEGPRSRDEDWVVLHERKDGIVRAVGLTPDGWSPYTRGGYPIRSRVVTRWAGSTLEADRASDLGELLIDGADAMQVKVVLYDANLPNGRVVAYRADVDVDANGSTGSGQICNTDGCSPYMGLIDTDFVMSLIDTDFVMSLIDTDFVMSAVPASLD